MVLYGSADTSKILTEVLIVLERPATFSLEPLQKMCDLVMFTFSREEVLEEEESWKLWNLIVNQSLESLNKNDKGAGTARYSSTKEMLLECMKGDSGLVWSAKRSALLDVWIGWIGALLNLDTWKEDEV